METEQLPASHPRTAEGPGRARRTAQPTVSVRPSTS